MRRHALTALTAAALLMATPVAVAHADHPDFGSREMFPGEGVVHGDQHGLSEGHLPPVSEGVKLIGKAEVTNPSGAGNDGRIADVSGLRKPRLPHRIPGAHVLTDRGTRHRHLGSGAPVRGDQCVYADRGGQLRR
jgi:hypothetical protein